MPVQDIIAEKKNQIKKKRIESKKNTLLKEI